MVGQVFSPQLFRVGTMLGIGHRGLLHGLPVFVHAYVDGIKGLEGGVQGRAHDPSLHPSGREVKS